MNEGDLALIADLANGAFGTGWRDAAWVENKCLRHEVSLEDSRVACREGEAVGYVLVGYPEELGAEVAHIGVVPGARRRGVGRALLDEAAAGRRGAEWLWLAVDEANEAAVACYRACGFEVARREPTWESALPAEPARGFYESVVFRAIEEPLEMYDWYDALPLPFDAWSFVQYRYFPGRQQAVRATRHGETIAAAYVVHTPDGRCLVAKLRFAEMADWIPEFLRAAGQPGRPLRVTDASGRYGQWFAAWGYTPGPVRLWMRRRLAR